MISTSQNDYLEFRELYHHGVKGQKWGVRRYQNEDGSLTEEGKQRYLYDAKIKRAVSVGSAFVTGASSTFVIRKLATGKYVSEGWRVKKGIQGIHKHSDVGKSVTTALLAGTLSAVTVNSIMKLKEDKLKEEL